MDVFVLSLGTVVEVDQGVLVFLDFLLQFLNMGVGVVEHDLKARSLSRPITRQAHEHLDHRMDLKDRVEDALSSFNDWIINF
jgi:hypothetical protein